MSYPDSVRYLYALGNELKIGAKFGLERMQVLLEELGHPERQQRFIHVAGTNGKGSTCAMIASVLNKAGYRTGLYTSPHLIEPTERIQINGVPVTAEQFTEAFDVVHAAAERLMKEDRLDGHPSYFETVTAMALLLFRRYCDIVVLETGLGGRLDATNVVKSELSIITPIAFDHEAFLGNTLESIAFEKAGIIKEGIPLLLAQQSSIAEAVIIVRAQELHAPVTRTCETQLTKISAQPSRSTFTLDGRQYQCPLAGRHQIENAVTAILACRHFNIGTPIIQSGLQETLWPGRLETVSRHPDFILDGAHNPAGAAALAAYIKEFHRPRPVWLVYGAMRDKAIDEVTFQLFPLAEKLIVTAPNLPRALRPETILDIAPHANACIAPTVSNAVELARAAPPAAVVFFTGSLFLVGESRELLVKQKSSVS